MNIVDEIINKYKTNNSLYIGEKITISNHMIQTAMLAEKDNSPKSLVCSCLLHDYGHFIIENPDILVSKLLDGKHEYLAFKFLNKYFKPDIVEPIKLHVQAKRYLCRDNSYFNLLSKASKISLKLQGGILNDDESKEFKKKKYFKNSILVRKFDESAKQTNIKMKSIDSYKSLLKSKLI